MKRLKNKGQNLEVTVSKLAKMLMNGVVVCNMKKGYNRVLSSVVCFDDLYEPYRHILRFHHDQYIENMNYDGLIVEMSMMYVSETKRFSPFYIPRNNSHDGIILSYDLLTKTPGAVRISKIDTITFFDIEEWRVINDKTKGT